MKEQDRLRWGACDGEHLELPMLVRVPGRVRLNTESFRGTDQNARLDEPPNGSLDLGRFESEVRRKLRRRERL